MPRELVRKMHAVGTVDEVTDYIGALADAGVRHFVLNPCASPDVEGTLETFSSKVLPQFRTG